MTQAKQPGTSSEHLRNWKGLQTERRPVFLDYAVVERMTNALLDRVIQWKPDLVGAIARGGVVPASMIATTLSLPMSYLNFDRHSVQASWIGPAPAERRVVLVDDGCSTGATM